VEQTGGIGLERCSMDGPATTQVRAADALSLVAPHVEPPPIGRQAHSKIVWLCLGLESDAARETCVLRWLPEAWRIDGFFCLLSVRL
jgi:hypothetical protein